MTAESASQSSRPIAIHPQMDTADTINPRPDVVSSARPPGALEVPSAPEAVDDDDGQHREPERERHDERAAHARTELA